MFKRLKNPLFLMLRSFAVAVTGLLLCLHSSSSEAQVQTSISSFPSAADRALLQRLIAAEDARARSEGDLAVLREGLAASTPAVRRFAVRAVGRLERTDLLPLIVPMMGDRDAGVREDAAHAAGQASMRGDGAAARAAVIAKLGIEPDPITRGALAETLGRLRPADAASAASTARLLVILSRA
jgi:hypothetical protein